MDENKLLKISLIGALIGVLILVYLTDSEVTKIKEVNGLINIKGEVNQVYTSPNLISIKIKDFNYSILLFTNELDLEKNDFVEIIAKEDEYNNQKQYLAQSITKYEK